MRIQRPLSSLSGRTFTFSGMLNTSVDSIWKSREELEEYLHHYGAIIAKEVNHGVDYLVLLDGKQTTSANKAAQLGIPILYEPDFNNIIGKRFLEAETINVPEWMDHIPADAFRGIYCFEGGAKYISCFGSNETLKSISLPDSITRIEHSAFFQCVNLTEIAIPEHVTELGSFAFCGCSNLKKVTLPLGLRVIGDRAFSGCKMLTEIVVPENAKIGARAFEGCSSLNDNKGFIIVNAILVDGLSCKQKQVTIPDGVTCIGESAFEDQRYSRSAFNDIVNVSFPKSLESIERRAFAKCKLLTTISLPEGLRRVGQEAFNACSGLKRAYIPASVTEIGLGAFPRSKLRIYAPADSYAEKYAQDNGIPFTACDAMSFPR